MSSAMIRKIIKQYHILNYSPSQNQSDSAYPMYVMYEIIGCILDWEMSPSPSQLYPAYTHCQTDTVLFLHDLHVFGLKWCYTLYTLMPSAVKENNTELSTKMIINSLCLL